VSSGFKTAYIVCKFSVIADILDMIHARLFLCFFYMAKPSHEQYQDILQIAQFHNMACYFAICNIVSCSNHGSIHKFL